MAIPADNPTIRRRTLAVTQQHFLPLFLMALVAMLAPMLAAGVLAVVVNAAAQASPGLGLILALIASLGVTLLTAALTLGMQYGYLKVIRGQSASVSDVFARLDSAFSGFLLLLFVGLRIFLWTLPGLVLSTLAVMIGNEFGIFLAFVGYIATIVLVIMATFRYCMAMPALADQPTLGVLGAFNQSKVVMQGRKGTYFALMLVIGLILFAICLVIGLLMIPAARVDAPFIRLGYISSLRIPLYVHSLVAFLYLVLLVVSVIGNIFCQVATLMFYNEHSGNGQSTAQPGSMGMGNFGGDMNASDPVDNNDWDSYFN